MRTGRQLDTLTGPNHGKPVKTDIYRRLQPFTHDTIDDSSTSTYTSTPLTPHIPEFQRHNNFKGSKRDSISRKFQFETRSASRDCLRALDARDHTGIRARPGGNRHSPHLSGAKASSPSSPRLRSSFVGDGNCSDPALNLLSSPVVCKFRHSSRADPPSSAAERRCISDKHGFPSPDPSTCEEHPSLSSAPPIANRYVPSTEHGCRDIGSLALHVQSFGRALEASRASSDGWGSRSPSKKFEAGKQSGGKYWYPYVYANVMLILNSPLSVCHYQNAWTPFLWMR